MESRLRLGDKTHGMSTPNPPKRCECKDCRVKLNLTAFPCRCGKYFCQAHRLSEYHNCQFDYRAEQKKELLKYMSSPVVGEKVTVI